MKQQLVLLTMLVTSMIFAGKVFATSHHNEWQNITTGSWGVCVPNSDKCNETKGTKTRTNTAYCKRVNGGGSNQCEIQTEQVCERKCFMGCWNECHDVDKLQSFTETQACAVTPPGCKVDICHRTASDTNRWNTIKVDSEGWNGHDQHACDFSYTGPMPANDSWCFQHEPASCGCTDTDGDHVCNTNDNCPNIANPSQTDTDSDGIGDACEGPINCTYTGWSHCSVDCGGGTQTREVATPAQYGGTCNEATEQRCNTQACASPEPSATPTPSATPEPSATPTPSATPEPSATPAPTGDREYNAKTFCDGTVELRFVYKNDDKGVNGKQVDFSYNDKTVTKYTDNDGVAVANYSYAGEEKSSRASYDDGSKEAWVQSARDCTSSTTSTGTVLGATTEVKAGRILGASTMAGTGVVEDTLMSIVGMSGSILTLLGLGLNAKRT